MALYLCVLPPLNLYPESNNNKKNIKKKIVVKRHSTKCQLILLKTVKVFKTSKG